MARRRREGAPELRPVEPTNDLNDEQKARLFGEGLDRMVTLTERKDELVAQMRNQRKQMRADGFSREEVDYGLWLRKQSDEDARDNLAMRLRIAEWQGKPLGYQPSLDLAAAQ